MDGLVERFASRGDGLRTAVGDATPDDPRPVLVVIDQFEEVFTACAHDRIAAAHCREVAAALVANLVDAVAEAGGQVRVVLTLRADFLDRTLQVPGMPQLLADPVLLGPMDDAALREAIVKPAQHVGAMFEKGLVASILRDVHDQDGALPLLQHALLELWERRRGPWLTIDAYERIEGIAGALRRRAEGTYQALTPDQQEVARGIFLRLVSYGEGVADTRRRVARDELYPAAVNRDDVDAVIDALSGEEARLLLADKDTVEITHEALLGEWNTLRGWLDADRDAQRVHRRLTHATGEWADHPQRDPGLLYRGARLAEATEWASDHPEEINVVEAEFLQASQDAATDELAQERDRTRRLRRRLYASISALAVAVVGVAAALLAFTAANSATQQAESNAARALAQQARALAPQKPALAMAVAAEALARGTTPEIAASLQEVLTAYGEAEWRLDATLSGHTEGVLGVAFAPDGERIATASRDGTAKLWDATSGAELTTLSGHTDWVWGVAFAPDGERIATASADGKAVSRLLILTPGQACAVIVRAVTAAELRTALGGDEPVACTQLS